MMKIAPPKPPNWEKIERKARPGKRKESTLPTTSASITQRIQRGTNLPSGKRKKTRSRRRKARLFKNKAVQCQLDWLLPTVSVAFVVPCSTSQKATSSAIQSFDLRQAMMAPTTK